MDDIAELVSKYNLLAVPVVDHNNQLQGMVVIDDVIEDLVNKRRTTKDKRCSHVKIRNIKAAGKIFKQLAIFLAILGPGIITGSVDNDAGGITVYSVAGAMYGYGLIWTLIPSFIVLIGYTGNECPNGNCNRKGIIRSYPGKCRNENHLFYFYWFAIFKYWKYNN